MFLNRLIQIFRQGMFFDIKSQIEDQYSFEAANFCFCRVRGRIFQDKKMYFIQYAFESFESIFFLDLERLYRMCEGS